MLKELLGTDAVTVHPHPIYDQFPKADDILPRRASLELLYFGFIRPYKGVDILVEAMSSIPEKDWFLTIAGECWEGEDKLQKKIKDSGLTERIEFRARYHSEQETAGLFTRADIVLLPYRDATGSGVIPVAYHYLRPVVATNVGGLPDVVLEGKTGWLVQPENPQAIADIVGQLTKESTAACEPYIERFKQKLTWDSLVTSLLSGKSFYCR